MVIKGFWDHNLSQEQKEIVGKIDLPTQLKQILCSVGYMPYTDQNPLTLINSTGQFAVGPPRVAMVRGALRRERRSEIFHPRGTGRNEIETKNRGFGYKTRGC